MLSGRGCDDLDVDYRRGTAAVGARAFFVATLEVTTESNGKQLFELTADETVVGRDQFCDIVLRRHTVSRQHARIVRAPDGFYIEDLSSLNGTYLNGRRLEGRTLIKDQDRIHIYEVVTVFHEASPDAIEAAAENESADERPHSLDAEPLPEERAEPAQSAARTMLAEAPARGTSRPIRPVRVDSARR